jgi:very-short-patch-repair endonuclease
VPDFMWPEYKVIVETDGWETHGPRSARRRDLARDRELTLAGWRVVRFTWADVRYEPDEVVRMLRGLLIPAT